MNRCDIVGLTLDQLLENFPLSPESFDYEDMHYTPHKNTSHPTIIWQPKVELKDGVVPDPNNEVKTIVVWYNENLSELNCAIIPGPATSWRSVAMLVGATDINCPITGIIALNSHYRKFMKLKRLIMAKDQMKHNNDFLKKLHSIFPGTFDKHIFGKG